MKTLIILTTLLIIVNLQFESKAQGEAAVPFLEINPSAQLNGLGLTGVSIPNNDALGFYYNPANLGHFSQSNNLSMHINPGSINWEDNLNYKFRLNNLGMSLGYNFSKMLNGVNLSIGAGFIQSKISYVPIGSAFTFSSYDEYNAYGLGVSLDYGILLSLGFTYKNVHSLLTDNISADINAIDYGVLISIPVIKLIDKNYSFSVFKNSKIEPIFNYNLGYSRLNIGGEISYIDPAQKDPIPRTARLGNTFNMGFNLETDNFSINLINYDLILEAEDILIERNNSGQIEYQGFLGDIKIGKHLFQLKGDNKVTVHKGDYLSFAETVTILLGSYTGAGYDNRKTSGYILSTKGLSKWLSTQSDNQTFKFIAEHLEFRYTYASVYNGSPVKFKFNDFSLCFMNFNF